MLHTHIAFLRKFHVSALLAASFLLVFAGLAVFPVVNRPEDIQAASTISETSLEMIVSDVDLPLSVNDPNGTFSTSDTPAEISVVTNNYTGYTLSIRAKEDSETNTQLVGDDYSFNSISSASSSNQFTNGSWGYLPSKYDSEANESYRPAPTYEGDTLDETNAANQNANTYSISIGAKADYSLPAGEYKNTFVITAVANAVGYSITYDDNTEDLSVSNMPSAQIGEATATSVTLASETPTRTGYTFTDWCLGIISNSNGADTCTGTTYSPSDTYDTNQTTSNVVILKAMWEEDVVAGYTINFDANDGTGDMNPQVIPYGESANLTSNTFTAPTNYAFDKWNTADDGSGTDYADSAVFTAPADDTNGSSITLYAQWKVAVYDTIIFDGNGSDGGTAMANQTIAQGTSAELSPNTYTKTGHYFNGWNTDANGTGEGMGDNVDFYATTTGTAKNVTLYAQWTTDSPRCVENCGGGGGGNPVYESGITIQRAYEMAYTQHHKGMYEEITPGSGTYQWIDSWSIDDSYNNDAYLGQGRGVRFAMQDISLTYNDGTTDLSVCDLVTVIGDQYRALDVRDNKLYYISKLKDGKCWMTQNLDLTLTHVANDADALYTHENTDLGWTTLDATAKWNPSVSTVALVNGHISNWTGDPTEAYSAEPGDVFYVTSGTSSPDTEYTSLAACISDPLVGDPERCMHYHAGNYYTWAAAVASESLIASDGRETAPDSICPAGWKLPDGMLDNTTTNDFSNLLYAQGITSTNDLSSDSSSGASLAYTSEGFTNIRYTPLFLVRGGSISSTYDWDHYPQIVGDMRSDQYLQTGNYATNVGFDDYYTGHMIFDEDYVTPDSMGSREGAAESVRCVAR